MKKRLYCAIILCHFLDFVSYAIRKGVCNMLRTTENQKECPPPYESMGRTLPFDIFQCHNLSSSVLTVVLKLIY